MIADEERHFCAARPLQKKILLRKRVASRYDVHCVGFAAADKHD